MQLCAPKYDVDGNEVASGDTDKGYNHYVELYLPPLLAVLDTEVDERKEFVYQGTNQRNWLGLYKDG